ncbi:uncharacterized protein G2W53_002640 [Senna tora]|uniref:Uncharacterized protein n=1 Tax=Senna tora TaxID=362788 RepID=A0A834X9I6_9FABA|nr:uncharacterized protein G2W53_002640 [Senna tora]
MILVAIVAEVLEEYTAVLARVVEQVFRSVPVPRRVRFLILHRLPFASSRPRIVAPNFAFCFCLCDGLDGIVRLGD